MQNEGIHIHGERNDFICIHEILDITLKRYIAQRNYIIGFFTDGNSKDNSFPFHRCLAKERRSTRVTFFHVVRFCNFH